MLKIDLNTLPLPDINGEVQVRCPECVIRRGTPDKKKHLYINIPKALYHCFRCDASGRIDLNVTKTYTYTSSGPEEGLSPEKLPLGMISLREAVNLYPEVAHFVMIRKLPIHLYPTWGYYKNELHSEFNVAGLSSGIIIPLFFNDKYRGYVIRFINPMYEGKWKYSKNTHVKNFLYNYDAVRGGECYVVEGVFDTLTLPECSVATFGKAMSDRQMELLSSKFNKVTLMYDGDAYVESLRYAIKLHKFMYEVYVVQLHKYRDPFDYSREELLSLPRRHVLEECLRTDIK